MPNDPLAQLARSWRSEAQTIRRRYGMEQLAALSETHAAELEEAIHRIRTEKVTLDEAAARSQWSKSTLRRWLDNGTLQNVGTPRAPRVLMHQVPPKAGSDALRILAMREAAHPEEPASVRDQVAARVRQMTGD